MAFLSLRQHRSGFRHFSRRRGSLGPGALLGDNPAMHTNTSLTRYAWLSIAAAIATILLKGAAWWWTGSVGLLSDALESFVNLAGALMALWMLTLAAQPPDEKHAYGHSKAEYFASGFEGLLILVAALAIAHTAINRLLNPQALEQVGVGLAISVVASLVNLGVARVLLAAGKQYGSVALKADSAHLMTDVWTSVGVIAGVAAVALTGWLWLDPILALIVATHILYTAWHLIRDAAAGSGWAWGAGTAAGPGGTALLGLGALGAAFGAGAGAGGVSGRRWGVRVASRGGEGGSSPSPGSSTSGSTRAPRWRKREVARASARATGMERFRDQLRAGGEMRALAAAMGLSASSTRPCSRRRRPWQNQATAAG